MKNTIRCPQCGSTEVFANGSRCICGACGHRFEAPAEKQEFESMRLFLSYGHPESAICQRIYKALKERGHEPWFDQSNIRTGDNWRTTIQEGVRSSQEVIACLSPHSTRERGVCLDELAIAVGVKGGNIHSVLLAPEQEVNPPATVGHEQWLDMSDWKEKLAAGPEVFDPWFHAKMQELFQVIESRENREFSGQIQYIHDHLNIYYDTGRQNALLQKLFVGRAWLEEELDRWLEDPDGRRVCLLHGAPGVGKSAFAVHYTHYNPRVAACLFCRSGMDTFNDPRTVIQTLAYLLACRLPEYRQSLLTSLPENKAELEQLSEQELFARLLGAPLKRAVPSDHATMVLVLDGLDECGSPEENALARTLAAYADSLPRWLRVLVVARATPAVVAYTANAEKIELASGEEKNLDDVRAYYIQRLQPVFGADPQWEASLDALTTRSQGVFLYAEMMCGLLLDKGRLSAAGDYPEGLDAVFTEWFAHFFRSIQEYKQRWRLPLGCILGAPAPLPEEELLLAMGWDENQLADFCRRINVLLRRDTNAFDSTTLVIDHAYVRQWLENELNPYGTSGLDGAAALAKAFYAKFEQDAESLLYYEAVYLPGLLEQAGRTEDLPTLLGSNDWVTTALDAGQYCREMARLNAAVVLFENLDRWIDRAPITRATRRNRSVCQNRLGSLYRDMGELPKALTQLQACCSTRRALVQEKASPNARQDLAVACISLADLYIAQGDMDQALVLDEECLQLTQGLLKEDFRPDTERALLISYQRMGDVAKDRGQLDKALEYYEKSRSIAEGTQAMDELMVSFMEEEEGAAPEEPRVWRMDELENRKNAAICYHKSATIYEIQGDLTQAALLWCQQIRMMKPVVENRGLADDLYWLGAAYARLAGVDLAQGDLTTALDQIRFYCSIAEKLAADRGTRNDHYELAAAYDMEAEVLRQQGHLPEALKRCQEAYALREKNAERYGTPLDRLALCVAHQRMSVLLEMLGRLPEALEHARAELDAAASLVLEFGTPDQLQTYATAYGRVGDVLTSMGRPDEAQNSYRKYVQEMEHVVQRRNAPADREQLALGYERLAFYEMEQFHYPEAERLWKQCLHVRKALADQRGTADDKRNLSSTYEGLALLEARQNFLDDSVELHQKCRALREEVLQKRGAPDDTYALLITCNNLAEIFTRQGQPDKALAQSRDALRLARQLVQQRGTPEDLWYLAVAYENLAHPRMDQGDYAGALELLEQELPLLRQVAQQRGSLDDHASLALACNLTGNVYEQLGQTDQARALYQEACTLQEQVAQERGGPEDQAALGSTYTLLGNLYLQAEDLSNAFTWLRKGYQIDQKLLQSRGSLEDCKNFAIDCELLGGIYEAMNDAAGARFVYQQEIAPAMRLAQEAGGTERQRLAAVCENLAIVLEVQGEELSAQLAKRSFLDKLAGRKPPEVQKQEAENRALARQCSGILQDLIRSETDPETAAVYRSVLRRLENL